MSLRRALVLGAVLAAGVLLWLDRHPIRLADAGPRATPHFVQRDEGHPVLLLVDPGGPGGRPPSRPADRWPDLEWENLLTQAYGGCDVASAAAVDSLLLDGRALVVLPRRTAAHIAPDRFARLEAAVARGLDLLVEAPDSSLCQRFGLELAAVERRDQLPWPRPVVRGTEPVPVLHPGAIGLSWTRFRYAPPPLSRQERPSVHLSLDGRPLGWVSRHGEGSWIVLAMDLAELSTRLRQGAPGPDLRLVARDGTGGPVTADLVAGEALAGTDDAWLDAWIEGVFGGAWTDAPLPRLAPAPYDADGWLLVSSHDLEGGPGVVRLVADPAEEAAGDGLLVRWPPAGSAGAERRIGLGPVRPFVRPAGLDERVRGFSGRTGVDPALVRLDGGAWSPDPDAAFAAIAGAGLGVDSSFGPAVGHSGWPFGSGTPFRPLALDGRVFDLWEIGLQAVAPGVDPARVGRWMRGNLRGGAGPIHLLVDDPSTLGELDRLAGRYRHRRSGARELSQWWERRSRIRLHPRPGVEGVRIGIEVPVEGSFALLAPLRWRDRGLVGWEADWGLPRSRRVQRFDRAYRLIEIGPSADGGVLELRYR